MPRVGLVIAVIIRMIQYQMTLKLVTSKIKKQLEINTEIKKKSRDKYRNWKNPDVSAGTDLNVRELGNRAINVAPNMVP